MALMVGIPHPQTDPVVTGWTFRQAAGCGTSNPGIAIRARTGQEREVPWVPWGWIAARIRRNLLLDLDFVQVSFRPLLPSVDPIFY